MKRVLILQGHPDASERHLGHALADAYAQGAVSAGSSVRRIDVGTLEFPLLRSKAGWDAGTLPQSLLPAQQAIEMGCSSTSSSRSVGARTDRPRSIH
jgi:putative NADPH-quinone reductase